jgi:hypothetical protein
MFVNSGIGAAGEISSPAAVARFACLDAVPAAILAAVADRILVFVPHRSGSMLAHHVMADLAKVADQEHFSPYGPRKQDLAKRRKPGVYGPFRKVVKVPEIETASLVVSLRDPRDVLVSMFFAYCYSHEGPLEGGTGYRAEVAERGIDDFVVRMATADEFPYEGKYGTGGAQLWENSGNVRERHERLLTLAERPNATLLTYETMVTGFEAWIRPLAAAVGVDDRTVIADLARKHGDFTPKGEFAHRRNVQPGDHRDKLKPETIARLDEVFDSYFRRLRELRPAVAAAAAE